jgi:uncharacterized protein YdiU (UPF0061 family)
MSARQLRKPQFKSSSSLSPSYKEYASFDQLDGSHPWMQAMPEGFVPYRVRELQVGEVTYFNYVLAKEMGLIGSDHPSALTEALKAKVIQTFSLQILNEYDELNLKNGKIDSKTIKPKKFMASRYLQLQHTNKQGKTSGDGRGIWNGIIEHRGQVWDVSSRGTGVTRLAPGAVEANRPLKTGATEFGYGCGQAEIDELYGAAIMAEVMHLQGVPTERVLCIIDLGKGYGIGVRAAPNLLRPAHLFMYLKQSRYDELKSGVNYLIERQKQNGRWTIKSRTASKYDEMTEEVCKSFGQFTAVLDIDYIFAWLDWDGDNVLADAGIIDYGSVRQFGIRHDQYRYDDVERFSTNLNEQRIKARLMVQVFVQMADYLKTKKKRPLKEFAKHPTVLKFNQHFSEARNHRLLYRIGFNSVQRDLILKNKELFQAFDREYSYFEKAKISGAQQKVADGVNHPALFNMRNILKALPEHYAKNGADQKLSEDAFFKTMLSSFAKVRDTKIRSKHRSHIQNFQRLYCSLLTVAAGTQKPQNILKGISTRAQKLNREDRITGNALIQIVFEIMAQIKKGMATSDIQKVIDQLIFSYQEMPEVQTSRFFVSKPRLVIKADLYSKILDHVEAHREDI